MKRIREEILSSCKDPRFARSEAISKAMAAGPMPGRYSRSPRCSLRAKIASFFTRPFCCCPHEKQATIGSLADFLTQVFSDLLERGIKTLTEHDVVAIFLHECVFAEIVFMNRT